MFITLRGSEQMKTKAKITIARNSYKTDYYIYYR